MSEPLREQAQWRKGKSPIIAKFAEDHQKLMSVIAGRGFTVLPGFAYELENGLELTAKTGLSELNQKILAETIERELKQAGIDYNLAYKNAAMTWEIEKQALLAAWDAEFAILKQNQAAEEEILNQLAIEVSKRAITLLEAKTAIEEDMEALRKTLAELDGTVAPYEVQLAQAKLLTAQKKVELIPILQAIITKEEELLVIEGQKVDAYTDYMTAEQELAVKKETLAPFVNELAARVETYAKKITDVQIPTEEQIADEKVKQSEAAVTKAGYQVQELTTEIETETKKLELMEGKRDLQEKQFDNEQALVEAEIDLTRTLHNDADAQFDELLQDERAASDYILDKKAEVHTEERNMRVTSNDTITDAQISANSQINAAEIDEKKRKAVIDAAANITAQLTHLIG